MSNNTKLVTIDKVLEIVTNTDKRNELNRVDYGIAIYERLLDLQLEGEQGCHETAEKFISESKIKPWFVSSIRKIRDYHLNNDAILRHITDEIIEEFSKIKPRTIKFKAQNKLDEGSYE